MFGMPSVNKDYDKIKYDTVYFDLHKLYIDGLVQERRNSSALAMELRLSSIDQSIWH